MAGELVGWSRGLGYAQATQNPRFREFRPVFHQWMGPRACESRELRDIQERENLRLLSRLLSDPGFSLSMQGRYPPHVGDPLRLVKISEDAMLPNLEDAKSMRHDLDELYDVPFDFVKNEMKKGIFEQSFLSKYLEEYPMTAIPLDDFENFAKAARVSFQFNRAADPVRVNIIHTGDGPYPRVQEKAQAEIYILALGHLPMIMDRNRLPYVSAIVKENIGLPHVVNQDDEYMGYHIEKGSIVWVNIWTIMHDEDTFPDPPEFQPERYLDPGSGASEIMENSFGFGRRLDLISICPGIHLAENSVFLAIATMLSVFHISKAVDSVTGEEINLEVEYDGFISHPQPFRCKIQPRSKVRRDLILEQVEVLKE
ncbi:cytochrome P450 [Desarmillaria ectypa]|nr:cytochrome P450 [Desarmillaria ectypa]